ncbi:MAG: hypothetical protein JRH20_07445 [Deltaproteobacteria bacterium]|nr:hypothetical protein [Deltaproteobacteria bacterium]
MRAYCILSVALLLSTSTAEASTRAQRKQVRQNKSYGTRRERVVAFMESVMHPLSSVQRERVLLNRSGKPIVDRKTGKARRFDVVVISPFGGVSQLIEVTGLKVDKKAQEAKTKRVFARRGGVYIRDKRNGKLLKIRPLSWNPGSWLWPTQVRTERLSLRRAGLTVGAVGAGVWAAAKNAELLVSLAALL